MKNNILIISFIITIFGITAFGFISKKTTTKLCEVKTASLSKENKKIKNFGYETIMPTTIVKQNLFYQVKRKHNRSITINKLKNVQSLSDVIEYYPKNWISNYISVEIIATKNNQKIKATSTNDILNAQQKHIFNTIDLNDDIKILVNYKTKSDVTNNFEKNQMQIAMTVIPETEARYIGGYEKMIQYLKETSSTKISDWNFNELSAPSLRFTVNKNGFVDTIKLIKPSGSMELDVYLRELIHTMPKWKPAKNSKGIPVKQEFEFSIGENRC